MVCKSSDDIFINALNYDHGTGKAAKNYPFFPGQHWNSL